MRFMMPALDKYRTSSATQLGTLSDGTFTHPANCIVKFTVDTLPTTTTHDIYIRKQDADNTWDVSITTDGDLKLWDQIATDWTERQNAAAALSGGERITVICQGDVFTCYYDGVLAWTHTSSTFQTETGGEVFIDGTGGAMSDLVVYPL